MKVTYDIIYANVNIGHRRTVHRSVGDRKFCSLNLQAACLIRCRVRSEHLDLPCVAELFLWRKISIDNGIAYRIRLDNVGGIVLSINNKTQRNCLD